MIALVTVPLSVVVTAKIGKRAQKGFVAQWKHVGALNGQIEEAFTGHALVKVFGRRAQIEDRFRAKNDELFDAGFRAQFISSMIMPAINFVGNLNYVAIAVVGGLRVASGAMLLGSVQAFIQYSRQFTQNLQPARAGRERPAVRRRVGRARVRAARRARSVARSQRRRRCRRDRAARSGSTTSSFRYKPDVPLIEHLSLVAKPGQTVAIVGPTGAGKTTLVNLLMRFYDLDGGAIRIDGVDIASVPRARCARGSAWCCKTPGCSAARSATTSSTATRPRPRSDMLAAAKATLRRSLRARAARRLRHRDRRGELEPQSTGEKQLITIARAFLADPAILILDEATSSVDTRTEVLVQRAMATLRERRTSFVIAHRLSTIRDADLILVMEQRQDRRAGHARRSCSPRAARTTRSITRSSRHLPPRRSALSRRRDNQVAEPGNRIVCRT